MANISTHSTGARVSGLFSEHLDGLGGSSCPVNSGVRRLQLPMKILILGVLLASAFCLSADKTNAQCTCSPQLTMREEFVRSDDVFVGRIIEVKELRDENNVLYETVIKVEVKQSWKRELENFVIVKDYPEKGFSSHFEPSDEAWLLYAHKTKDGSYVAWSCCSRTKRLSRADEDLKQFKKWGETPKKIIQGTGEAERAPAADGALACRSDRFFHNLFR